MQLNLPEFGKSSQVVRRPDNSDENSSNASSYCGSGFPLPFGSIPGLVDMAGSCHEDMLAQYRHIHLPSVSSKGSSLKELTDPSTLKLRKRVRPSQPGISPSDEGESNGKPRQRRRLENNPNVFGHLAAIRRKQYHMESHSQVVPVSPHLPTMDSNHHPVSLHTAHSTSPVVVDKQLHIATPTKPDSHSFQEQPFISSYQCSPAVGGSNQFSPVIIEGAHLMLPSVESSYQPTIFQDGESQRDMLRGDDTIVSQSDTSFSVPALFDGSQKAGEENGEIDQSERDESPIFSGCVSRQLYSPFTNHTLTPYTTSPHTLTRLHPSQEPLTFPLPTHTHSTQDRLDVANFSIIRYCPREE